MQNNFDEANTAAEEMFENNNQAIEDATAENNNEDTGSGESVETAPEQSDDTQVVLEDATGTAEAATQAAADMDSQLKQAMNEIDALKQQNAQMQGTIDELSKENTEKIIDEAIAPPVLDINSLAFADEATQQAAMQKFAQDMGEYNRKQILEEISPAIEYAQRGIREAEKNRAIEELSQIPELSNLREMLPQLDNIIAGNKWLQSDEIPMDEKYINAYAIARGVNSINTPSEPEKAPTTEELMNLYNNNPDFQDMIEKQRLEKIKQSQQVPPFSASSGAVNAALDIKDKPKTMKEAAERTREMFDRL